MARNPADGHCIPLFTFPHHFVFSCSFVLELKGTTNKLYVSYPSIRSYEHKDCYEFVSQVEGFIYTYLYAYATLPLEHGLHILG